MAANQYPKKPVENSATIDYRRGIGSCVVCKMALNKRDAAVINPFNRYMVCKPCANTEIQKSVNTEIQK